MPTLNTWASQQNPSNLSPLDRLLNQYIQGDAPLAYIMRGDPKGLWQDLNTPRPVNMTKDITDFAVNSITPMGLIGSISHPFLKPSGILPANATSAEKSAFTKYQKA